MWPFKKRKSDDDKEIWVCAECECACCWAGILRCRDSQNAGIKKVTKGWARALGREHPFYLDLPGVQA